MKTQVIKLDLHDDVVSVRDKMSWAKTERILLVFPPRARILARTLDLRLLQRHAATLGAQLAIVSGSDELRRTAEKLSLPAFEKAASARHQVWERKKIPARLRRPLRPDLRRMRREAFPPEARWRSLYGFRFSFFTLAVLAIIAILSLFIPSATIQLSPETRRQSLTFTVSASPNVTNVNLAGSLPARLTSVVVEHNKTIRATGSVTIPDAQAQGLVRFTNLTTGLAGIPSGTVVSTRTIPPVRYITTVDAIVVAGLRRTVDVPVKAVEAGSNGNLPADTLVAFEKVDLGTSLSVTNPNPTTGGSDRTAVIQTTADRSLVHDALSGELLEKCKNGVQQTLIPGDVTLPDTLVVSQIISETYFPAKGQSGEALSLTMRLQCQVQYASLADVNTLAEMSLDANLPKGFAPASDGLAMLSASIPLTDSDGISRWDEEVGRSLRAQLDPLTAVQLSLGRKPADAILLLYESLSLAEPPIILVKPNWWPWLPIVPLRISVSIDG